MPTPKKLLLVEDDNNYSSILKEKLTEEGFEVMIAENGSRGIEILQENAVDLIVLDLVMPQMDGVTFCHHLSNLHITIPIVILSNLSKTAYPSDVREFIVKSNTSLDEVVEKIKANLY